MSRYVITTLLALALAANLLVPKQIVRYRACCYDSNGNLALHLCGCKSDGKTSSMSVKRTCCDPMIARFNANPNSPVVEAPVTVKYDAHSDLIAEVPQASLLELSADYARVSFWDTGPPRTIDVLSLHSRLNL